MVLFVLLFGELITSENTLEHMHLLRVDSWEQNTFLQGDAVYRQPHSTVHTGTLDTETGQYMYDAYSGVIGTTTVAGAAGVPEGFSYSVTMLPFGYSFSGSGFVDPVDNWPGIDPPRMVYQFLDDSYFTSTALRGVVTVQGPNEVVTENFVVDEFYDRSNVLVNWPGVYVRDARPHLDNVRFGSGKIFQGLVDGVYITIHHNRSGAVSAVDPPTGIELASARSATIPEPSAYAYCFIALVGMWFCDKWRKNGKH